MARSRYAPRPQPRARPRPRAPWLGRGAAAAAVLAAVVGGALAASTFAPPQPPSPYGAPPSGASSGGATAPGVPGATTDPTPSATATTRPAAVAAAPGDPAARCVRAALTRMTPAERAGQVVMVGIPVGGLAARTELVRRHHLGGVFLSGRSTASVSAVRREVAAVQSRAATAGVRLHVAVDQEGGQVQSLRGSGFGAIPSARVQGGWSPATLHARTLTWAGALARAGVTLDLAPVADTVPRGTERGNPPIGAVDRQYGATPEAVGADVATVTSALQQAGVTATVKHFPGLGRVRSTTDTATTASDPLTTATDPALEPFRAAVRAGAGAVMVSSARYPRLAGSTVAAFSPAVVTDLLRHRLGFTGLVVSDDLGAAAAVRAVAVGTRAVRFVAAGGDLVLTVDPATAGPMATALARRAAASTTFAARLDQAVERVLSSKYRRGLLRCS